MGDCSSMAFGIDSCNWSLMVFGVVTGANASAALAMDSKIKRDLNMVTICVEYILWFRL